MIPTVGRIVHFRFPELEQGTNNHGPLAPAIITRVWSDTCVNLKVIADGPADIWKTSVIQGDGDAQWSWPPRTE